MTDPLAPLRALQGALCARDAASALRTDLRGFLSRQGLEGADLEAMVEAGPTRLLAYRTMVQGRLRRTIKAYIPRVAHLLGNRYAQEFCTYMEVRAPRTHYLRDVPAEFVAWARERWATMPDLPAYLGDLARYEILRDEVANAPGGGEPETGQALALDRPLRIDGSAQLQKFAYAVHEVAGTPIDQTPEPPARATTLLVYRNRKTHRVHFVDLTPRAGALMRRLLAGEPVQVALAGAASDTGGQLNDEFLAAMVHFLTDLSERGVVLGAEP